MNWTYEQKEIQEEDIPEDAIGFIYLITNKTNDMKYIGKKLLTKAGTEKKLLKNGTKKTVKCRKPSDWKNYYSSCDELKKDVVDLGKENFTREILYFSFTLTTHSYLEDRYLFDNRVLERKDFYNSNIGGKYFKGRIFGLV